MIAHLHPSTVLRTHQKRFVGKLLHKVLNKLLVIRCTTKFRMVIANKIRSLIASFGMQEVACRRDIVQQQLLLGVDIHKEVAVNY